jgi:hypothetical protein
VPSIFISHASPDRQFVENELLPLLRRHDIRPWYSNEDIPSAAAWEMTIREGLKSCEWFLVVVSPAAIQSKWVQAEVHWAVDHRADKLVPLLAAACDPVDLNLQLIRFQHVDFTVDRDRARRQLLATWGFSIDEATRLRLRLKITSESLPQAANEPKVPAKFYASVEKWDSPPGSSDDFQTAERELEIQDFATIGRAVASDIVLPDKEGLVSRNHAGLRVRTDGEEKQLWIFNLGTNGTYVNDTEIVECQLKPGDAIQIGSFQITIIELL